MLHGGRRSDVSEGRIVLKEEWTVRVHATDCIRRVRKSMRICDFELNMSGDDAQ